MKDWRSKQEIKKYLQEDIGYGDLTSEAICRGVEVKGDITAKEDFIVSGLREAGLVFEEMDVDNDLFFEAGEGAASGEVLMRIEGRSKNILTAERLALNLIMRMSGIATKVRRLIDRAPETIIAATRKTTPGFRLFEKKAVEDGGGDPHRFRLDDMLIIKDNHIELAGGIEGCLEKVKKVSFSKKIDIEVTDIQEAETAAEFGVDIIMLDNMDPEEVKRAYKRVKQIDDDIIVEVSGGIDESNIEEYAPFADVISSGSITHSVSSVDVSMRIIR